MARMGYAQRIKARISELQLAIETAQKELEELRVAERVLSRLGSMDSEGAQDVGPDRTSTTTGRTVADMAVTVIEECGPLDTPSVLEAIRIRFNSELQPATLSSTLSRTKSAGRLSLINGKWSLPQEKTEPPGGGSEERSIEDNASIDVDELDDLI